MSFTSYLQIYIYMQKNKIQALTSSFLSQIDKYKSYKNKNKKYEKKYIFFSSSNTPLVFHWERDPRKAYINIYIQCFYEGENEEMNGFFFNFFSQLFLPFFLHSFSNFTFWVWKCRVRVASRRPRIYIYAYMINYKKIKINS